MKKLLLVGLAVMFATPVWAKDYTLTLNDQDIQLVGSALGKQPYNDVKDIIAKLQDQINKQIAPPPSPTDKKDTPDAQSPKEPPQ